MFTPKVVKTIEPVVRPKGLGLGATKPKQEKVKHKTGAKNLNSQLFPK